jgi:hypothetical protein
VTGKTRQVQVKIVTPYKGVRKIRRIQANETVCRADKELETKGDLWIGSEW